MLIACFFMRATPPPLWKVWFKIKAWLCRFKSLFPIDKVYIYGSYGLRTLDDVSHARFERVSHATHLYR